MNPSTPHFLLFSQSDNAQGAWKFVLRSAIGPEVIEVSDQEPGLQGQRLELLSVVRGLEALDQPSRVTLMTASKYVREGIRHGLSEWQANGWRWEFFGEMVPVKNRDLWQRIERAMLFHQVDYRTWRIDPPHMLPSVGSGDPILPSREPAQSAATPPALSTSATGMVLEEPSLPPATDDPMPQPARGSETDWGATIAPAVRRWRDAAGRILRTLVPGTRFG